MIPDSHAHLDMIEQDTGAVVASAREAGVHPIITIGITISSSLEAIDAASKYDGVYASAGIHPNDTAEVSPADFERLEEIASSSERVVAIGETGLDYYRERASAEAQKSAFRAQVGIARRLGKPLIVHDREAHDDALALLAEEARGEVPVIMHCFSGGRDVLDECLRRGYYFSFAGPITFKKSDAAREMARLVPGDRLLCETDSPFLSPEPFRGKPNVPARVVHVASTLAAARGVSFEEMEAALAENTARAFGIPWEGD
ncbi:MAG: TatD family hydrolase [Candidatus Geothermincolia bacterium]